MNEKTVETLVFRIFLAGDYNDVITLCRNICNKEPICVSVKRTDYVYTNGMESGVEVTVLNYPRFPSDFNSLNERSNKIARQLMRGLFQSSVMVVGPEKTTWFTTREVEHK